MKFGIIYCGYNNLELTKQSLPVWIEASKERDIKIAAVSVPFAEYKQITNFNDGTTQYIKQLDKQGLIDVCFDNPTFIKEADARNLCLFYLLSKEMDYIFIVDSDELYTKQQIFNILNYVEENKQIDCFEINLKNYIFDGKSWIDGFHPFRIFKTKCYGGLRNFFYDNDVVYNDGVIHKQTKTALIPKEVAHIKHITWLNKDGKQKVQYHLKHFGDCSYKWNEQLQTLEIDFDYYKRHNYQIPIIFREE